eukprot:m51a1_g6603 putative axoneme central apparatus (436) ;mRNA; r:667-2386
MNLLRPLLLDTVPSVQHNAAQALGRLANFSPEAAEKIVNADILPQLVYSLSTQNIFYKKAAAFVLRSVARHNARLAQRVVEAQAPEALVQCLETLDPGHTPELAQSMVDAGVAPLLVVCVQEPEVNLKTVAASSLADIAKHTPELAQVVVNEGAITFLAPLVSHKDAKLKRQALSCLCQIAKHSPELAEAVDADALVRKNAATVVREVVKHTAELARLAVNAGGAAALVDYVSEIDDVNKLPGIMALGFIAACNETLAWAIVSAKGVEPLAQALSTTENEGVRSGASWTLGQIGRHTPEHAAAVADANVLARLLQIYTSDASSEDVKKKAKRALKAVVQKCLKLQALEPLLDSPINVQKYVVHQFSKVLPQPSEVAARKAFVASGGLAKVLKIDAPEGSPIREHVNTIKACYDEEIVKFYSPGYSKALLDKIDTK